MNTLLKESPAKEARTEGMFEFNQIEVKQVQANGFDGSGPWLGVHLRLNGNWVAGGWVLASEIHSEIGIALELGQTYHRGVVP